MAQDQQERQGDPWSAYAAEGISSTSLGDCDQARYENSDSKCRTSPGSWRPSALRNDSFPNAKSNLTGSHDSEELARQLVARRGADREPRSGQLVGTTQNHRGIPGRIWFTGLLISPIHLESGMSQNLQLSGVHSKLLDVEKGCSEMEDDH